MKAEVTYTIIKDAPVVDVGDFFGRPDITKQSASANVWVAEHDDPPEDEDDPASRDSFEYYEINGQGPFEISPIQINNVYQHGEQKFWVAAPIGDTEYQSSKTRTGNVSKNEDPGSITTSRSGNVNVRDTTILVLQNQAVYERQVLEDSHSNVIKYPWERTMEKERSLAQLKLDIENLNNDLWRWKVGWACGDDFTLKDAIISALELIGQHVLGYLLTNDNPNGSLLDVEIIEGYRDRSSVSGSKSFNEAQPAFTVSH
jgi:hypothetical protein